MPSLRRFIMQAAEKPSLYDRLGGVYSIATVGGTTSAIPSVIVGMASLRISAA